ncbi:DUF4377 domain-containing protein [Reinekea sp. G2M2-21]|uniref:DUF4377 domain-containing protein n=1 Tax=Reinekea sp. G2M2-21 TaxID=2788942 RepID=UPI0018A8917A|nr:DUF4377 domain-containing protein [Reinekea sp. G2M2-21]
MKKLLLALIIGLTACNYESDKDYDQELYIDHYKSECEGEMVLLCLRTKLSSDDDWSLFYDQIEGFNYKWGYSYKLRVKLSNLESPPQDASSVIYSLVEIVDEVSEHSETAFDMSAGRFSSGVVVNKTTGVYELYGEKEFSCVPAECSIVESLISQDLAILFEFKHNSILSEPMRLSQIKCSDSRESFHNSCL